MSATILGGEMTIYFSTDNQQLRVEWTGPATGTRTMNEYYSASKTLEALSAQMSERVWVTAQTPVDYTQVNGYFIDDTTMEHMTGGTLQSSGWGGGVILKRGYDKTGGGAVDFVVGDIGLTVTGGTTGDTGVLLDFNTVVANEFVVIRADVPGPANDAFDDDNETLISDGTGSVQTATPAVADGESVWSNPNTIATLATNTLVYIYQSPVLVAPFGADDKAKVIATKGTDSWWLEGNIDICLKIRDVDVLIDEGYASFFARQFSQTYSHSVVDLSAGARTPIALETQNDINNNNGHRTLTCKAPTDTWPQSEIGGRINEDIATPTKEAVLTSISGTTPTYVMQHVLVASQANFVDSDVFENLATTLSATVDGAPAGVNAEASPATTITITHANITRDLNNGNGSQPYSAEIDAQQVRIDAATYASNVYELLKFETKRGVTTTDTTDGIEGEQFIGNELHLNISSTNGTLNEGEQLWMHDSGDALVSTGILVANHGDSNDGGLQLRNVRTYTGNTITQIGDNVAQGSYTDYATVDVVRGITPVKGSPFGTLAGGVAFLAPGVWLTDFHADDAQAFRLIDDIGVGQTPPNTVAVTVTNLISGDTVAVFRRVSATLGSAVKRDEYAPNAQQGPATPTTAGAALLTVTGSISNEAPDAGKVQVVDTSNNNETLRYRYSSLTRASGIFTFTTSTGTATGGSTSQIVDSGADFVSDGVEVGDICRNTDDGEEAIVTQRVDLNTLNVTTTASTWSGKVYEVNTLARQYEVTDDVWVPFILRTADTTEEANTMIHTVDVPVRVVVRNAGTIEPQEYDQTIAAGGMAQATIRNPDSIFA